MKTGVEEVLQEKVVLQERRSARGAKRGKCFSSSSEDGSFKRFALKGLWCALDKRFKRFAQHGGVLLPVVGEASFPQDEGTNAILRYGGFAIGDDVLDVLTGP